MTPPATAAAPSSAAADTACPTPGAQLAEVVDFHRAAAARAARLHDADRERAAMCDEAQPADDFLRYAARGSMWSDD